MQQDAIGLFQVPAAGVLSKAMYRITVRRTGAVTGAVVMLKELLTEKVK